MSVTVPATVPAAGVAIDTMGMFADAAGARNIAAVDASASAASLFMASFLPVSSCSVPFW